MSKQVSLACSGHTRPVMDLAFSSITEDGFFLISTGKDGNPMLRYGMTGDWIGTFMGHKGAVWSARLNNTATRAVTGSADFTAKLWDTNDGHELHSFLHKHMVRCVEFKDDDGYEMITAGMEKIIRIFDLNNTMSEPNVMTGHEAAIKTLAILPSRHILLSGGDDKKVKIWDLKNQLEIVSVDVDQPITSIEVTRDESMAIVTAGKAVHFMDTNNLKMVKTHTTPIELSSASLHPEKNRFIAGGSDCWVHVYSFEDGLEMEVHKGHHGPVHCVRYAPDGKIYASGSEDGTVRLWQTNPGTTYGLWQFNHDEEDAVTKNDTNTIKVGA